MVSINNWSTGCDNAWTLPMTALAQATLSRSPAGRVIAIMVNFNGKHFLDASIGSALAALEDHHGDLLLVDNASCDGSADYVPGALSPCRPSRHG